MPRHQNSFDFLRLLFALLVIITHSVVLSGAGEADFLSRATGGQINCSYLGVRGFFVISGFLIFKSLQRSSSIPGYLRKRFLRIFPGLVVMLLVVTFLIGPAFTELPAAAYLRSTEPWRYMASALRLPGIRKTAALPGLFTHNPYTNAVNGSLWTIWFELLFYFGLLPLFLLRRKTAWLRFLLPAAWAVLLLLFIAAHPFLDRHIFPLTGMSAEVAVDLGLYFLAGMALTVLNWHHRALRPGLLLAGLLLLAVGLCTHLFSYLRYAALPLMVIAGGHYQVLFFRRIRQAGEPSYGIYIYAYPLQQLLVQCLAPSPLQLSLLAIPLTLAAGYASWHIIEQPFLRLKENVKPLKENRL